MSGSGKFGLGGGGVRRRDREGEKGLGKSGCVDSGVEGDDREDNGGESVDLAISDTTR